MKDKKKDLEIIRYNPSISFGLDTNQINERIENKLVNKVKNTSEKSYFKIIFDNIFTFFNIIMIALAVLLVSVMKLEIITNLGFLLILAVNTTIGIYQECKCKKALKKLKLLHTSKIEVLRDGKVDQVLPDEILLDDILILKPGDQIPADCIIESDGEYEVNESLMTGESCSIKKKKGDLLLAGSYVVTGKIYCRADKIAENTYLHSIESKAKGFKKPKSMLISALNKIIKILVLTSIPVGIAVGWSELIKKGTEDAIMWGSLSIVYSVPAGMILLASVAMMVSVIKLSKKKTLTQDLYSVEALSRIDTLCLDKTGTLTDGTMTVEKVIFYNKDLETNGIISSYLSAFDSDNQTSRALVNKFGVKRKHKIKEVIPFSSERKYSAVHFDRVGTYILGAPEYLTKNEEVLKIVQDYAEHGLRVVILIKSNKSIKELKDTKIATTKDVMAMFILRDNIRKGVTDTIKWFNENDVNIRVISGDNVKTVAYIAKQCGIKNSDKYIDLSTIDTTDKELFRHTILTHQIYGRVNPDQKAQIVDILREEGHIVGMTGDGVNDVISLKKADCSIALGSGAPATKNISNFILLDDDFNNMKDAVLQGRGVINNVQRSSSLFVMKDILWLIMMILPIILGISHVFESTVISLVNLLITGLGSLCLALEPSTERIKGDFYHTVFNKALIAGIYMSLPIIFIHIYAFISCGINPVEEVEALLGNMVPIMGLCITIAGFIIFYNICRPFTKYRAIIFLMTLILTILLLFAVPDFFLLNGTEFMQELLAYGNLWEAIKAIFYNMFSLEIYREFAWQQWVIVGSFLLLSSVLYIITTKIVNKVYELRNRKESEIESLGDVVDKIKTKIKERRKSK